jgi:hypothetical protein
MKFSFAACLIIASPATMADTSGIPCETLSSSDEVSPPLTIYEIETQARAELLAVRQAMPKHPDVLFGSSNARWVGFKSMYQPGDKIIRYRTDKKSWARRSGYEAFVLVRSGCIINRFVTMIS